MPNDSLEISLAANNMDEPRTFSFSPRLPCSNPFVPTCENLTSRRPSMHGKEKAKKVRCSSANSWGWLTHSEVSKEKTSDKTDEIMRKKSDSTSHARVPQNGYHGNKGCDAC